MLTPGKQLSLSDLAVGATCKIASVELAGLIRRRILDLGILPGTKVKCVRRSPSGDPIAFQVRGTTIALRDVDASSIKICAI